MQSYGFNLVCGCVHTIERSVVKTGEPVLYLHMEDQQVFVREELQLVPSDTEKL